MKYQHQDLASGRWQKLDILEQMSNIGSEVMRAINWRKKGNEKYSEEARTRALELIDLTIKDRKNIKRLKELTRLREILLDYFIGGNQHSSSEELWHKYFYPFNYAARNKKFLDTPKEKL